MPAPDDWNDIDWRTIKRAHKRLRRRISTAALAGDWKRVLGLQWLMSKSLSSSLVAVKRAAEENRGSRTAGIDGKKDLDGGEKLALALEQRSAEYCDPLISVHTTKSSGGFRELRIPTIRMRAQQSYLASLIEPAVADGLHPHLYGALPGRSIYDAIVEATRYLEDGPKYSAVADIEDFYGSVPWDLLMGNLHLASSHRKLVSDWLRTPAITSSGTSVPTKGLAQGNPISPILAHITLQGMHEYVYSKFPEETRPLVLVYVDDIAVFGHSRIDAFYALSLVREWLAERGYHLNEAKTSVMNGEKIVSTAESLPDEDGGGIEYLGVYFLQFPVDPEGEYVQQAIEDGHVWDFYSECGVPVPPPVRRGWNLYLTVRTRPEREYGAVNVATLRKRVGDLGFVRSEHGTQLWY